MGRWFEFAEGVKIHLRHWPSHWYIYRVGNVAFNHLGEDAAYSQVPTHREIIASLINNDQFVLYSSYHLRSETDILEDIRELKNFIDTNWLIQDALHPKTNRKFFEKNYLLPLVERLRGLKIINGLVVPSVYTRPPNSIDFIINEPVEIPCEYHI